MEAMIGTTLRADARDEPDGSHTEKLSGCCAYCDDPADGIDARDRVSVCSACADREVIVTDGGTTSTHEPPTVVDRLEEASKQLRLARSQADKKWDEAAIGTSARHVDETLHAIRELRERDAVDRGDGIETDGGLDEPFAPPRGAKAHICSRTGSTVYCALTECPYCDGGER